MRPLGIARTKAIRILFGAVLAAYYCLNLAVLPSFGAMRDRDGDRMPNRWEVNQGLNPNRANGHKDADHDGLENVAEYRHSTDATDEDSDNDGLDDGDEVGDSDTEVEDSDGVEDGDEDSDFDGIDNEDADDQDEDQCENDQGEDNDDQGENDEGDDSLSALQS